MEIPSLQTILIAVGVIIVIVIVIIFVTNYNKKEEQNVKNKLVKFGGQFRHASGLNLGHQANAPIFNARPYINMDFNMGLKEYLGIIKIPKNKSFYCKFPNYGKNYDVIVLDYPSWDQIGEILYSPEMVSVGYTVNDNIVLPSFNSDVLFLVTGINLNDDWLEDCILYFDEPPSHTIDVGYKLEVVSDIQYGERVDEFYNFFITKWLEMNPGYTIVRKVDSVRTENTFPPSLGVTDNIVYTPDNLNETLVIVYPNRVNTLNKDFVIYTEVGGARTYLQQDNNFCAGVYLYPVKELDTVIIEEKLFVDKSSSILPFNVYVAFRSN